jgi:hypothetical protein
MELKLYVIPIATELLKFLIDGYLLIGRVAHIFDFLFVLKDPGLQEMVHHEAFLLCVGDVITCDVDDSLPMSFLD